MRFSLALLALIYALSARADLPYWVCIAEDGAHSVQDRPCADSPNMPPSGYAIVQQKKSKAVAGPAQGDTILAEHAESLSMSWFARLEKWGIDVDGIRARAPTQAEIKAFLLTPWPWLGLGALLALWLLVKITRGIAKAVSDWRYSRRKKKWRSSNASTDTPVDEKPAEFVAVSVTQMQNALPSIDAGPSEARRGPSRFSPTLLRKLKPEQFGEFCLRLWRMRGLRAAYDPEKHKSRLPLILLQRPAEPRKPYGIALCVPEPKAPLGAEIVMELIQLMELRRCSYGAVMTPGEFTSEARDKVRGSKIELKGSITLMIELESLAERQRRSLLEILLAEAPDNESETNISSSRKDPVL